MFCCYCFRDALFVKTEITHARVRTQQTLNARFLSLKKQQQNNNKQTEQIPSVYVVFHARNIIRIFLFFVLFYLILIGTDDRRGRGLGMKFVTRYNGSSITGPRCHTSTARLSQFTWSSSNKELRKATFYFSIVDAAAVSVFNDLACPVWPLFLFFFKIVRHVLEYPSPQCLKRVGRHEANWLVQGSWSSLERHHRNTTKIWIAFGNSHLACGYKVHAEEGI